MICCRLTLRVEYIGSTQFNNARLGESSYGKVISLSGPGQATPVGVAGCPSLCTEPTPKRTAVLAHRCPAPRVGLAMILFAERLLETKSCDRPLAGAVLRDAGEIRYASAHSARLPRCRQRQVLPPPGAARHPDAARHQARGTGHAEAATNRHSSMLHRVARWDAESFQSKRR